MRGVCAVCGCTDDNACVTETGPCTWFDDGHEICSACIEAIPELHLVIPRMCRYCQLLEPDEPDLKGRWWTCSKGRFNGTAGAPQYYTWSGIWRARYKTVKKAQKHCPEFLACKNIDQIHASGRPA